MPRKLNGKKPTASQPTTTAVPTSQGRLQHASMSRLFNHRNPVARQPATTAISTSQGSLEHEKTQLKCNLMVKACQIAGVLYALSTFDPNFKHLEVVNTIAYASLILATVMATWDAVALLNVSAQLQSTRPSR
jgi:hypothetical protein